MKYLPLLLFIGLFACESTPESDPGTLYGDFYVRYIQDGQQIKAEAWFTLSENDSIRKPYAVDGGVSFQGSGMGSRDLAGRMIRYQYENKSDYPSTLSFQLKDHTMESHTIEQLMTPVDSFSVAQGLSISKGGKIELFPGDLQSNEQLVFLFTDAKGQAKSTTVQGPIPGTEINPNTRCPCRNDSRSTPIVSGQKTSVYR